MASEKIKLGINLRKNTNSKSLAFGKYYPEVDQQKTLSLRGFAQHMALPPKRNKFLCFAIVF